MAVPQVLDAQPDDGGSNLVQRFAALMCTATLDGRFLEVNPALELALGYGPGELTSCSFATLAQPEAREAIELLTAEFPYATAGLAFDLRCLRKDGSSCWMAWNIRVDAAREIVYCSARDLTASREHASVVTNLLAELERSNSDLAQFAYVASHDLSEPLRMVSSYVQLLSDRYRGQLDTDADEFIAFAVDGANRMKVLIDDLLTYSRAGTGTLVRRPVDCAALVHSAISDLDRVVVESNATVVVGDLPVVNGDPGQLALVFRNLLSNALKFVAPDVRPEIRVHAARDVDAWRFTVEDNGIGIAENHRDRIFLMFKRLHGRSEYPGTGIGLALCHKIITRIGGRIWLEGDVAHGSAFHFTVPDVELAEVMMPNG